jgi:WD40 repeat protein
LLHDLEGHTAEVLSIRLSPDEKKLASGAFDGTARIWDASTGALLQIIQVPAEWTFGVAWSADGSKLATACGDRTLRIWDIANNQLVQTAVGYQGYVYSADWSPDDGVVSASQDVTIRLWSPRR